jgi:hypothetical protein
MLRPKSARRENQQKTCQAGLAKKERAKITCKASGALRCEVEGVSWTIVFALALAFPLVYNLERR